MAMTHKGSCLPLLLPLVMLGTCLALSLGKMWSQENEKFLLQHWNYPRTVASNGTYCNIMTQRLEMQGRDNTFIHAPVGSVNSICSLGGTPGQPNERLSVAPFDITVCTFNAMNRVYMEERYFRCIVLACWKGIPVGYLRHT